MLVRTIFFSTIFLLTTASLQAETLTLPDGSEYEGPQVNDRLHGEGTLKWPNGDVYVGEFSEGQMAGAGELTYALGAHYSGNFLQGYFHGQGEYADTNGSVWTGEFEQGKFQQGTVVHKDGSTLTGQFANWQLSGEGQATFPQQGTWSGQFKNGVINGKGHYENEAGVRYDGGFARWSYHGDGELTLPDGTHYVGQFQYGQYQGHGELTLPSGETYVGEFEYGEYSGDGKQTLPDGEIRTGVFDWGYLNGTGRIDYPNGDWYEGNVVNNQYQGTGSRYTQSDNTLVKGLWQAGKLVARIHDDERIEHLGNLAEQVLYNQNDLLQTQFDALLDSNPEQTNAYLLAVGGDGNQEVFRREVLYAQQLFDTRFATKDRSVVLINSKETAAAYPVATVTSIEKTLQVLAGKMNPEKDILLLYLTSHGSADHQLYLNQPGMGLVDLSADYLAQLLRNFPVRAKVVMISACYSGGFIDALKDDTTLVMTSAAKDKTSFGCSDDADFTYFGRALLEQSLQQTQDFRRAFHSSVDLVEQWEKEEEITPSKPKLHAPQPILDTLAAWYESLPGYTPTPTTPMELTQWWWRETKQLPTVSAD
ncbi:C13 family peptidase [Reinekea sp. G2M2-21]|uniref:C13 family peptidase n=1 Tax=Reinekea sp. G2M2-21 TaxID=2788942 RepID=UPI0018A93105|nr:C13 family peptidase [Reinekea sp. G2M2-21]